MTSVIPALDAAPANAKDHPDVVDTSHNGPRSVRRPVPLSATARRRFLLVLIVLGGLAAAGLVDQSINTVLAPDAEEITWLSDVVLALEFVLATWLWLRLRETTAALSELERERLVAEDQLSLAARVQRSLLPETAVPHAGIAWSASVEPAQQVGGDYYDVLPLPDGRTYVALVDVSGKGVPAAVFVANVRAILRLLARDTVRPRQLAARLSAAILEDSAAGFYVTCIVALVDPASRSMTYVNAGHPAGVLWSPRRFRGLSTGGPPLGLLSSVDYDEEDVPLADGDLVVFVSDGITEALDAGSDGTVRALAAQIERTERHTPDRVCAHLLRVARDASGPRDVDGWTDDRTAVVFEAVARD